MQDVDGPSHIQSLSEPARTPRPRVHTNALRVVTDPERLDRISGHRSGRRYVRKWAPVRPPELERPVGQARDLVALLVHRPMMPATEERKIRQRRRAAVGPVAEMMPLGEAHAAAREAATLVSMVEGAA